MDVVKSGDGSGSGSDSKSGSHSDSDSDSADIDEMWIEYNVQRLIWSGDECVESISFLVLNVCDGDDGYGVDEDDLDDLICGFKLISKDGKDGDDVDSEDIWGVKSSGTYGVRINHDVEDRMTFRLCLKNVFSESLSDRVQLRRGEDKDLCAEQWVEGLPCLDRNEFVHGAYSAKSVNGPYLEWHDVSRPRFSFYDILSANQQFLFLAVVTVVAVGAFVSLFSAMIEWKKDRKERRSRYGHVIKMVASDADDGTESESISDIEDQ